MKAIEIIGFIPAGRQNAVSRTDLKRLTGISDDRKIRDLIKQANRILAAEGRAILSSSGTKGYWITDDIKEMEAYLEESSRRSKNTVSKTMILSGSLCAERAEVTRYTLQIILDVYQKPHQK